MARQGVDRWGRDYAVLRECLRYGRWLDALLRRAEPDLPEERRLACVLALVGDRLDGLEQRAAGRPPRCRERAQAARPLGPRQARGSPRGVCDTHWFVAPGVMTLLVRERWPL